MKKKIVLLSLLALSLIPYCYAQTYRVVILGSLRMVGGKILVDPGVWGTNLIDDTMNGVLEFDVIEHPLGYDQKLGASEIPTEVGLLELPIIEDLEAGDHVRIDYKNCIVEKSYTKRPLKDEYHIFYVGQANTIPEFSSAILLLAFMVTTVVIVIARKACKHRWRG